jgi:hypothetical protein
VNGARCSSTLAIGCGAGAEDLNDNHRAPDRSNCVGGADLDHLAGAHLLSRRDHRDLPGLEVYGGAAGLLSDGQHRQLPHCHHGLAAQEHAHDRALSGADAVSVEDVVFVFQGELLRHGGSGHRGLP